MILRKVLAYVTAILLVAAAVTLHGWAQDVTRGDWKARFDSDGNSRAIFYLEMRMSDRKHDLSWGDSHKVTDFAGLDPALAFKDGPAQFELRREAGTFSFDGSFHSRRGTGKFHFTPNRAFVQSMKDLGYSGLSMDQLLAFTCHDVTTQFVKDLNSLGYRNVSADDVGQMHELVGKDLSADDLVSFRIHGVSPEFVKEMNAQGYRQISAEQLVSMRIHGINAAFVKPVREHGYKDPTIEDLIDLRIHGLARRASM